MANANELWNELCKDTFGVMASELRPPPDPTRMLYVWSHRRLKETFYQAAAAAASRRGVGGMGGLMGSGLPVIPASNFRQLASQRL